MFELNRSIFVVFGLKTCRNAPNDFVVLIRQQITARESLNAFTLHFLLVTILKSVDFFLTQLLFFSAKFERTSLNAYRI